MPLTSIQSPTLTGRSISKIMPDTKLETIFCNPKPIPTESAPATIARDDKSKPVVENAIIADKKIPT